MGTVWLMWWIAESARLAQIEALTKEHFPVTDSANIEEIKAEAKETYEEAKEMLGVDDYM